MPEAPTSLYIFIFNHVDVRGIQNHHTENLNFTGETESHLQDALLLLITFYMLALVQLRGEGVGQQKEVV